MRRRVLVLISASLATLTIVAAAQLRAQGASAPPPYRLAPIAWGSVVSAVAATGTLTPELSVPVAAAGSGPLLEVAVDDNATVRAGEVLARIDPTAAEAHLALARTDLAVAEGGVDIARSQRDRARIGVANAEAARDGAAIDLAHANDVLADAQRDLKRVQSLARTGDAARVDIERAQATLAQAASGQEAARAKMAEAAGGVAAAKGDVQVAELQHQNVLAGIAAREAALRDAELEVEHTEIRAPIDGTVLDHTAAVGQQVAAGQPGLFTIVADLHRLLLQASVNEADIGRVAAGQQASFTVEGYPGEAFGGEVLMVRRAPQTVQNVVTYDVVISVANPDEKLLPGMTATTRIVTAEADGVLRAPAAALRFKAADQPEPDGAVVWTVDAGGHAVPHRVTPGVSDGAFTAIDARDLGPGDAVVVGLAQRAEAPARSRSLLGL